MRKIDELFLSDPFLGARRIALMLGQEGFRVNRKRVKRLMRVMGLVALGPKPRTSKPAPGYKIFPYLLKGMRSDRPNQVWAADITYIPIGAAFSISWPSWTGPREQCSPSGSPTPWIPRSALKPWTKRWRAMVRQRSSTPIRAASSPRRLSPTASSSLRTSAFRWTAVVGYDNIFIERLWCSMKHEDVYLKGYADGREARAGIGAWIFFYNERRPHQGLAYRTPMTVWRDGALENGATRSCGHVDNARASYPNRPTAATASNHDMAA